MKALRKKPDLCSRCKRVKLVQKLYMLDPDNKYKVQGKCDRCEGWSLNLWSMVEKSALDRLAEI